MENIKEKTINALSWSAVENFGTIGINMVTGIFLARMLLPEEFGLIGMLVVFISLGSVLTDSGFGAALIQKKNLTEVDKSSVFFFNVVIGSFISVILYIATPAIARFYSEARLISLGHVLSVVIFIGALSSIQLRLMSKDMDFRTLARINLIATAISGLIALLVAKHGFGVWSLVVKNIGNASIRTLLFWIMSPWRPKYQFQFKVIRELFPFGSRVLFTGLISAVFSNISRILIGKFYLATDLGHVERAHALAKRPFDELTLMMARVLFPSFSSIQDNKKLLLAGFRKSLKTSALLMFPMLIGIVVCARPIVIALLTEKWAPIIPYVQILAIESLFQPFFVIHLNLFKAIGRSDLLLKAVMLNKVMTAVAIITAAMFGIKAMLLAQMGVSVVSYGLVCVITSRLTEYPIYQQIKDWIPYMAIAMFMGSVIAIMSLLHIENIWLQLFSQISVGAFIFILVCGAAKMSAFFELKDILVSKLKNKRQVQVS